MFSTVPSDLQNGKFIECISLRRGHSWFFFERKKAIRVLQRCPEVLVEMPRRFIKRIKNKSISSGTVSGELLYCRYQIASTSFKSLLYFGNANTKCIILCFVFSPFRIEEYINTGKDKFVIDPDPNLIYTKRKLEKLGKSQTLCVTSSNSPVRSKIIYPKDSWSKSLKKLPLFTRAEMDEHVARTGKHLGNSKDHKVPTGLRKAKTFQKDQYLKDIQTNYDQRYFYFKCSCYHSFRKNDTPHELHLTLCIVSGQVIDSLCTCAAGKTGFCNHSLALMFLICKFSLFNCNTTADHKDDPLLNPDVACTSKLHSWHKKVRGDSIYPQPVMDVVVSKTKLDDKENEGNCVQSILYEARKNKTLLPSTAEKKYKQTLRQINPKMGLATTGHIETELKETKFGCSPVGSYASYQLSHTESNFVVHCNVSAIPRANNNSLPLIYPQFPFKKFEEYALPENLSELERDLIDSFIVDENCINKTEKGTRDQCASEQWKSECKYRFTASKFQLISRRQRNHSSFAQDLMYPKPFQSRYTKHGTKYEPVSIDMYQKYMKSKEMLVYVFKCGFIILADLPFLGGSPDGKIIDPGSSKPFGLLEVKRPETKFLVSPFSACSDSNFFCYRDGEKCKLKTSHAYYAQVQGQMGVSGVEWCDFVVYTKKGMSVERIPFKKQYWNDLKQPSNYYFAHFIQHAAADYTKIYQVTQ